MVTLATQQSRLSRTSYDIPLRLRHCQKSTHHGVLAQTGVGLTSSNQTKLVSIVGLKNGTGEPRSQSLDTKSASKTTFV